jgi:maleylacetate reductase
VIVRWGIGELGPLLSDLRSREPLLVTSERFGSLDVPVARRFTGVRRHAPVDTVGAATDAAVGADALVALGGGSAVDTGKAVSAAMGLPLIAVPTTYAGAEWTPYYGVRDEAQRVKRGGSGARTVGVVYEPALTCELPRAETVGTALNALAHAAEALYAGPLREATSGAHLIGAWLPRVAADGDELEARARLLEGAMHAGKALAARGLFLAHAMAQALGGRYGLPHGAMNALCLPPVLRFNAPVVPDALAALADSLEAEDPVQRIVELALLAPFEGLRDFAVPEVDLVALAEEVAARAGARANPRPASARDIEALLRAIW